jgi:predicted HTH domain antitoxin
MPVTISDEVLAAAQISEPELKREIALALFQKERLTLAQASSLAEMPQPAFQALLAERHIPIHRGVEEFHEALRTFLHKTDRTWPLVSALLVAIYFLVYTRGAWHSYFSNDDVTNLYRSWIFPLSALVKANFLFFLNSPFYRPLASVWYRSIFYFAGFHPLPFHAVNLLFLGANIWLTYCVSRRLSGSREVAAAAALLISYHPRFGPLYFDTGFVFDVLCYFFYLCALLFYIRIRQRDRPLGAWELAACAALYICALNSKEMAATLPAVLLIYELLYSRARRDGRGVAVTGLLTVVFATGRFLGHGDYSLLVTGAYRPVFSLDQFMKTSANFFGDLFLQPQPLSPGIVLAFWAIMLAAAWASKSRTLQFAWLFLMLTPIPVAFILPRGAPQYYVAFFGWALYAATVFVRAAEYLLGRLPSALRPELGLARGSAMLLAVALLLYPFYGNTGWVDVGSVSQEGEHLRSIVGQLHDLRPALRPESRLLFLDDPTDDSYRMGFLIHLSYQDPSLVVARAKAMNPAPDAEKIASYDYVFDYRLGSFYTSPQPRPQGPEPAIEFQWGWPAVFHSGFLQVRPESPAKPDEEISAMVTGLGETRPPTPPGQPFPKDPLRPVVSSVSVRVGGKPAKVDVKVGWPETIDAYRVDFRVPKGISHGEAAAQITVNGVTGPEVRILVE